MSRLSPLAPLAPLGSALGRQGLFEIPRRQRRGPQLIQDEELSPEEEKTLLGKSMGAVQYIAEMLDKPGAAVRGLAAGRPGELANLVPFSGTSGMVDVSKRTSGRQLLEQVGLAGRNIPGLFNSPEDFAGDVGGFMVEVALDPWTWFTGPLGAISKIGKAATAAKAAKAAAGSITATLKMGAELGGSAKVTATMKNLAFDFAANTVSAHGKTVEEATGILNAARNRLGISADELITITRPTVKGAAEGFKIATEAAGGVARGLTPSTWGDSIRAGERAWMSLQAPWLLNKVIPGQVMIGTGKFGGAAADVTSGLLFRNPISLGMRSLVTPHMKGALQPALQIVRDRAHAEGRMLKSAALDMSVAIRATETGLSEHFTKLAKAAGEAGDGRAKVWFNQVSRAWGEKLKPEQMMEVVERYTGQSPDTIKSVMDVDLMAKQFDDLLDGMKAERDFMYDEAVSLGFDAGKLVDAGANYLPRRVTEALRKRSNLRRKKEYSDRALQDMFEFGISRDILHKHWPGGTAEINRLGMNSLVNGTKKVGVPTVAEGSVKGIQPGVIVQAADRQNFGKVMSLSEDGKTANVFFRNPDTFAEKEVLLPVKQLTPQYYGAPDHLAKVGAVHYERLSKGELRENLVAEFRARGMDVGERETREQLAARLGKMGEEVGEAETRGQLAARLKKMGEEVGEEESLASLHTRYIVREYGEAWSRDGWETSAELYARKGFNVTPGDLESLKRTVGNEQLTKEEMLKRFVRVPVESEIGITGKTKIKPKKSLAQKTSAYFRKYGSEVAHGGLFDRRVAEDHAAYVMSLADVQATMRSTHKYLDDLFTKGKGKALRLGTGAAEDVSMTSLAQAWDGAGFGRQGLVTFAKRHFAKEIGKMTDDEILAEVVPKLLIDPAAARPLKALNEVMQPMVRRELFEMAHRVTSAYKGMLTVSGGPISAAFHTRNVGGGFWNAWVEGKVGFWTLMGGFRAADRQVRRGEGMRFAQEFVENGGLGGYGRMIDIFGEQAAEQLSHEIPKGVLGGALSPLSPSNIWKAFRERGIQAANPLHTRGVYNAPKSILGESGDKAYNYVEFLNRGGYYEALREKGYRAGEAMEAVNRTQFKYSEISPFGRDYGRIGVLFWGWLSKNIPYQFSKIFESPGGRAAQTIRAVSQGEESEYVPSFLREGMAVRTGGTERATTYLRQSGIPIEDLNKFTFSGGWPSGRTFEKFAAALHPLIQMPVEVFAGKQLYTGRTIKNLKSTTGIASEALGITPRPWMRRIDKPIHYSPFSRVAGELLGVIDKRKPVGLKMANALTGVKFSTYDAKYMRMIDLRRALEKELQDSPYVREGIHYYIPESDKPRAVAEQEKIRRIGGLARAMKVLKDEGVGPP